jgi:hypothetical protein
MATVTDLIAQVAANNSSITKLEIPFAAALNASQSTALGEALKGNTTITEVDLANKGLDGTGGAAMVEVIRANSTIKKLDLGYNAIPGDVIAEIGRALATNTSLEEVKLHRQAADYGNKNEEELVKLWDTNTTLTRLYCTLHDRRCNSTNTRGEVRNKEISKRKQNGKPWDDLNPDPEVKARYQEQEAAKRAEAAAAAAAANAPITAKVESTGGPYTLKQLTCAKDFLPDDLDVSKKETYLPDEDFQELFKMDKEAFAALPAWKRLNLKKQHNLH